MPTARPAATTPSSSWSRSAARVLSVPDFARGLGQQVNTDQQGTALGSLLPIRLSDADGVYSVDFELTYDASLMTVSGVSLAAGMPGTWNATINGNFPGRLLVTVSGTETLTPARDLVAVNATVTSDTARYREAAALRLQDVRVNEGNIAAVGDWAVQKVAFFGDASGDGSLSGFDANKISRVVVQWQTGFDAFLLSDPRIVADVTGDGTMSGFDASMVARKSVGQSVGEIPDALVESIEGTIGADPTVNLPADPWATAAIRSTRS